MPATLEVEALSNNSSPLYGLEDASFALLYQNYSGALYGAIHKVLRNTTWTEDALQNTFVKIWLHRNSYDSCKGSPFTWMLNIARNEALDVLRSKHHRQERATTPLYGNESIADRNPFLQLDRIDIHKLLFLLKPQDRVILELCFFRGFTCQEVSEILHLPCGSVKTKMQQSYKKLKKALIQKDAI